MERLNIRSKFILMKFVSKLWCIFDLCVYFEMFPTISKWWNLLVDEWNNILTMPTHCEVSSDWSKPPRLYKNCLSLWRCISGNTAQILNSRPAATWKAFKAMWGTFFFCRFLLAVALSPVIATILTLVINLRSLQSSPLPAGISSVLWIVRPLQACCDFLTSTPVEQRSPVTHCDLSFTPDTSSRSRSHPSI